MIKKNKIILFIITILLLFIALIFLAFKQAKTLHRDPMVLLNRYYLLKKTSLEAAQKALIVILRQDNSFLPALTELSQTYLNQKNTKAALPLIQQLHELYPNNPHYTLQLGYLYYDNGEWEKASPLFQQLRNEPSAMLRDNSLIMLNRMASFLPSHLLIPASKSSGPSLDIPTSNGGNTPHFTKTILPAHPSLMTAPSVSKENILLNQYYALKKNYKKAAWHLIQKIIRQYPNNLTVLKEGGFLALHLGHRTMAITYFTKAYHLTHATDLALQLGYLYDQPTHQYIAYKYFKLATLSQDKELMPRAQNALTNIAGYQTKELPLPYFSEFFFAPFSQSRFGLTVRPLYIRAGVETNQRFQTKAYLLFRQTEDNRSNNSGQLSQIYEDNVRVIGAGLQISPIPNIPFVTFLEAGGAYDLIYQDRKRWRGDLRTGLIYYNEFGAKPAYYGQLKMSTDYYSTIYSDVTYFSRYDNVIATLKTHQGIRLLQYHSSMVNLYLTGRIIEDSQREFFNNIAEIGPGISFTPSNRFRVQLRFEHINGAYLPAGKIANPYGKYYTNNTVQLFIYIKI